MRGKGLRDSGEVTGGSEKMGDGRNKIAEKKMERGDIEKKR